MTDISRFFRVASFVAFAVVTASFRASADESAPTATWRHVSNDPLTLTLAVAETLLDRDVPALADDELVKLAPALKQASPAVRERYGVLALRAALERGKLDSPEGRAETLKRVEELRTLVEGSDLRKERFDYFANATSLDDDAKRYALALAKAYCALGTLDDDPNANVALDASLELTKRLARSLPTKDARPFLYWLARGTLANRRDPDRCANAEKFGAALEKSSRDARDEHWFFACAFLVETARESGDFELAARRIKATLAELQKRADDPEAPHELAAALVAQEIRLLVAERKLNDALRQATLDVDLLNAPFPENAKRWNATFFDPFDDLNLARVELYWRAIPETPSQKELERRDPSPVHERALAQETLVEEARRVARLVGSNVARAQCSLFARDAGESSQEWSTLELAAQESFRAERWFDALERYDRAAKVADDGDDAENAYRLRAVAAALVDKILRDNLATENADLAALREDAANRFEALSREDPTNQNASAFFLLALEYRESLSQDDVYARFEYLKLFPDAPNRSTFALALARRSLDAEQFDDARQALDYINVDDPRLDDALALERAVYASELESGADRDASLLSALERVYSRATNAVSSETATSSLESLAERLDATRDWTLSPGDVALYASFFDLAIDANACRNASFARAAANALQAWRDATAPQDATTRAKIDARRLSLALATGAEDAIVAILSDADVDDVGDWATLESALALAENAAGDAKKRLATFALDAIEKTRDVSFRAEIARADALRLLERGQESLNLYARLRKSYPKNVAVARGIARLLTAQKDAKTLRQALGYWSDVADLLPESSKEWWDAKEETISIYCRLGDVEQAEKIAKALWLTRDESTDLGRRKRWEQLLEASRTSRGTVAD